MGVGWPVPLPSVNYIRRAGRSNPTFMASPEEAQKNLHQLQERQDQCRVISGQQPQLLSSTTTESAELVAPLRYGVPSQAATSITADHRKFPPDFEAQKLHQLNDKRRVISSQAPQLVSYTANESAGLLVAPLVSVPSQEATSITAKKLVAGTSTTSAERTSKIGVTFRTDEPATYNQHQRQHQLESGHLQTLGSMPVYIWPARDTSSTQRSQPSGTNYLSAEVQKPTTYSRTEPRGGEQNGQYSRRYFQSSSSYRSTLLNPPHPVRTPYGNDWASNEVPPHAVNQAADAAMTVEQAVNWLSSLGYQINPRRNDECSPALLGPSANLHAAINPCGADEYDCVPRLTPINPDNSLRPPHPVRTPYGKYWASNEIQPHAVNQVSSVKTIESLRSADVLCRRSLNYAHLTPIASCKNETSIYDYVKLIPLLPKIDSNDLCGSLENLISRFEMLNVNDPTHQLWLAIAVFPEAIISSFTKNASGEPNFNDFVAFIRRNFPPTYSIHRTFPNETTYAQLSARAKIDMLCPKAELFKFYLIQRSPSHLRSTLKEHLYLDERQFLQYAKFILDNNDLNRLASVSNCKSRPPDATKPARRINEWCRLPPQPILTFQKIEKTTAHLGSHETRLIYPNTDEPAYICQQETSRPVTSLLTHSPIEFNVESAMGVPATYGPLSKGVTMATVTPTATMFSAEPQVKYPIEFNVESAVGLPATSGPISKGVTMATVTPTATELSAEPQDESPVEFHVKSAMRLSATYGPLSKGVTMATVTPTATELSAEPQVESPVEFHVKSAMRLPATSGPLSKEVTMATVTPTATEISAESQVEAPIEFHVESAMRLPATFVPLSKGVTIATIMPASTEFYTELPAEPSTESCDIPDSITLGLRNTSKISMSIAEEKIVAPPIKAVIKPKGKLKSYHTDYGRPEPWPPPICLRSPKISYKTVFWRRNYT